MQIKLSGWNRLAALLVALLAPLCAVLPIVSPASAAEGSTDVAAIEKMLRATFERPDAPLTVSPVVVEGGHSIAGWVQHGRGGRALLAKKDGGWKVVLCAGDGLKDPEAIEQTGMPRATAKRLAGKLAQAEAKLTPQHRAQLAMFEGVVRIDAAHGHPPVHGGAHGAPAHKKH